MLEVIGGGLAALGWFTYDEAGGQRWLFALGQIVEDESGQRIDFDDLYISTGGRFGADFDPEAIERQRVGEASMRFANCEQGSFSYNAFGHSQTLSIQRLAFTMAAGCRSINGTPGEPIKAYAGQSGSWFDPERSGEGFQLQWTSRNEALLGWYTFDVEGRQMWMTGSGRREADRIVFPALYTTRGARFGADFDPTEVEQVAWSSLVLELDCDAGTANYESSLPAFGSGELSLIRLTGAVPVDCPWTAPKLTDLYDVTLTEIEIDPGMPLATNNIQARSIADDGTIAALRPTPGDYELVIWFPERQSWETVTGPYYNGATAQIAQDGKAVLLAAAGSDPAQPRRAPAVWTAERGAEIIDGLIFDESYTQRASRDFSRIIGRGRPVGDPRLYPWVWDAALGQVQMPLSTEIPEATPTGVANDGRTVVGHTIRAFAGSVPLLGGVIWKDGGPPNLLSDEQGTELGGAYTCSENCEVVFGRGSFLDPTHPNAGEAWFWRDPTTSGYLGKVPGSTGEIRIASSSADGTIAVGVGYAPIGPTLAGVGLIWTQNTGLVLIPDLIEESGQPPLEWDAMSAYDIVPGGRLILLIGDKHVGPGLIGGAFGRVVTTGAVLRLLPKEASE